MRLTVDEVARRLDLPTSTIERWIRQGRIPVQRRGRAVRFDERELEAWAMAHRLSFSAADPTSAAQADPRPDSLLTCMERGGVHHELPGHDVASVLRSMADVAPVAEEMRAPLFERLLEREGLSSTGIGGGVAIPHPRSPLTDAVTRSSVTTCFLQHEVDFDAIDGKPVFVVFLLLSPAVKTHLHTLARLAFSLRSDTFLSLLSNRPSEDRLLEQVSRMESDLEERDAE